MKLQLSHGVAAVETLRQYEDKMVRPSVLQLSHGVAAVETQTDAVEAEVAA